MDSREDKKTILVVDDTPVNISLLSNILSTDYRVKAATSGEKAIEIAQNKPQPDLILLDIVMPGMSGYDVCEQLKQDSATATIPVIFVTAKTTTKDEQHGLELGAVDYITKPISPAIVKARVQTQLTLQKNIVDLQGAYTVIEKQKDRMQQELNVGRDIQLAMVPKVFPLSDDYALHAVLEPCREVGGDFYDAFVVDGEHICFCVGDVSGKGVPAALFMAMAKTLIKSRASSDLSTASIVTHVNDELSKNNEGCLFVTLFVCIFNVRTGELLTTNAGHNPPFLKHADGSITTLSARDGLVVAAMEGIAYTENRLQLNKGDTLLLFTDGITEADNINQEFFGDDRLEKLFHEHHFESMEELTNYIVETTHAFEGLNRQADDITVLAFHYAGQKAAVKQGFEIDIGNDLQAIEGVTEQFMDFARQNDIVPKVTTPICMALDDLLANIISYGYLDDSHHLISIKVSLVRDSVVVVITDDGLPFNPFTREGPDTELSLEEREIGGLGIFLVKNVIDETHYKRHVNKNVITLVKKLTL
jgi:serine phosphatase RsbU (regulator of sigma subunit)/anti-sigma regulatory factor (Ser/Thr protein kinase)